MQWVKQKTFRAQFIACVKPKISSDMFLAHMEDVHCLKRRSMTARVGCLFQQCFSFLFFSVFLQTAVLMVHMILIMCMMEFE